MGTGEQRPLDCIASGDCATQSGPGAMAVKQRLLAPKALASGPDGSIYLADYDLIRRVTPDGQASTLLRLK